MSYIHTLLLRRGRLSDLLPEDDSIGRGDKPEWETAREEIQARAVDEQETRLEVEVAISRLKELNRKNHYGESLKRAFEGR